MLSKPQKKKKKKKKLLLIEDFIEVLWILNLVTRKILMLVLYDIIYYSLN